MTPAPAPENSHLRAKIAGEAPVAIIGASAASLFAAHLLACEGVPVRVIEQSHELAPQPRTLIVTSRMNDLLGGLGQPSIVNRIRQFELFTDGRAAKITLDDPDLIIERSILIRQLAAGARQSGAALEFGRKFRNLRLRDHQIEVELETQSPRCTEVLQTNTLVGGDGASSRVAYAGGWPKAETAPLVQAIVELPQDMQPDTVRIWFVPSDTPYFYWLIPESAERGVLGLIGEFGAQAKANLERFLIKRKMEALAFQGARIPVYKRWTPVKKQFGGGEIYLVGDAASHVKVSTVGGIVTGLRGAAGVAAAILRGSSAELRKLRRELGWHLMIRRAIHGFEQEDYSRLVDLLNASAKQSLSRYSRDEALKVLWRVCLSQPRFLLTGLRRLVTSGRFQAPSQP